VAQVRFTEWTSDGLLRHPVYLGLRDDKPAREVVRESSARQAGRPVIPVPKSRWHRGKGPLASTEDQRGPNRGAAPTPAPEAAMPPHSSRRSKTSKPATPDPKTRRRRKNTSQDLANDGIEALVAALAALEKSKKDAEVQLPNGDALRFTNLAKVFWPELGITKGELIRFYANVSPLLLPVVDDRPMVMKRFPNGVATHAFYQQRHPETPPKGVRREVLPEDVEPITEEGPRDRLIGGSLTTLLYMAQLAAISQDPWFSRVRDPFHQDHAAIDLDPGDGTPFSTVIEVARTVKAVLDEYDIPGFPKTSGASGLHIYVPLPKGTTYETGQLVCHLVATAVVERQPKIATIERTVKRRPRGTVYVDYLQNILGKTLATAYSVRASDYAGVSTPLEWDEVTARLDPRRFTIRTALARFRRVGDLWANLRRATPANLKRLAGR
jgi:bifunctional non-homologous end joining protein LigD